MLLSLAPSSLSLPFLAANTVLVVSDLGSGDELIIFNFNFVFGGMKLVVQELLTFWKDRVAISPKPEITAQDAAAEEAMDPTQGGGCGVLPPFVAYTQIIPWHEGARHRVSQWFPRHGNYCGPNYSSGRESGALKWDKEPVDWLDHCCYRHDIGYDTLDQTKLNDADKQFLTCLQTIPDPSTTLSPVGRVYHNIYIVGLVRFLIPYRDILLRKMKQGKQGEELAPEVIVKEVKEQNADTR